MAYSPHIRHFLSDTKQPVCKESKIWNKQLPVQRSYFNNLTVPSDEHNISYNEYFKAIDTFFKEDRFESLLSAVRSYLKSEIDVYDLKEIGIFLKKHGALYHPARVEVMVKNKNLSFAVNVAISKEGRKYIQKEQAILKRLEKKFPFFPSIYHFREISLTDHKEKIPMFMAQWMDGFHEFHISHDKTSDKRGIILWDQAKGNFFLSKDHTMKLYCQAAKILTCLYNLETFEEVAFWNHAAGDFIVGISDDNKIELKLITVRSYKALFEIHERDPLIILEALLIFLINMSIKMRLDRLDGIGEIAWAHKNAVKGTIKGFFKGLSLKPEVKELPDTPLACFKYYFSKLSQKDIYDLSLCLFKRWNKASPETPVIKKHLKYHALELYDAIYSTNLP